MREFSRVQADIIGDYLAFAVEFPLIDQEAAFGFTIYEL
jgi:hypothetical protein